MNINIRRALCGVVLLSGLNAVLAQNPVEEYFPYRKGKRWGYCNPEKKILISPRYSQAGFFTENYSEAKENAVYLAIVKKKEFGVIDNSGKEILPCIYDKIEFLPNTFSFDSDSNYRNTFFGEFSLFLEKDSIAYQYRIQSRKLDTLWSLRDAAPPPMMVMEETRALPSERFYCNPGNIYKIVESFKGYFYLYKQKCWQEENLAVPSHENRYTYKQITDTIVVKGNQLKLINTSLNNFLIKKETGWGLIDFEQKQIIEPVYDTIAYTPNTLVYAAKKNERWRILYSEKGEIIKSKELYDSVVMYDGSFYVVKRNKQWGVYLSQFHREILIGKRKYADYHLVSRNLIEVRNRKKKLVGYVHLNGTRFWD